MPEGKDSPKCTHVVMTLEELNDLETQIENGKAQLQTAVSQHNETLKTAALKHQKEMEKLSDTMQSERTEKERQIDLNATLLRISRERANADRKIKPKKTHCGYVVLSSRQKKCRYKDGQYRREVYLWETVIQTPYEIGFSAEQVMSQTQELFVKNENRKWLLDRFGIDDIYPDGYEELIDDSSWSNRLSENIICEITYGVTVKTGYWEMTVTHTKPVSIPSPSDGEPNE